MSVDPNEPKSAVLEESSDVPKFIIKDHLQQVLSSVGAVACQAYAFGEVVRLLKAYLQRNDHLFSKENPAYIECKNDPLGDVFGVVGFYITDARDLIAQHVNWYSPYQKVSSEVIQRANAVPLNFVQPRLLQTLARELAPSAGFQRCISVPSLSGASVQNNLCSGTLLPPGSISQGVPRTVTETVLGAKNLPEIVTSAVSCAKTFSYWPLYHDQGVKLSVYPGAAMAGTSYNPQFPAYSHLSSKLTGSSAPSSFRSQGVSQAAGTSSGHSAVRSTLQAFSSLSSSKTDSNLPGTSYIFTIGEVPDSCSDAETTYSTQGYETALCRNTEPSDIDESYEEYEIASEEEEHRSVDETDSEVEDISLAVVAFHTICQDSDEDFFADQSDSDFDGDLVNFRFSNESDSSSDDDPVLASEKWACLKCGKKNKAYVRYCAKCWQLRKDWFPDRPKKRRKRKPREKNHKLKRRSMEASQSEDAAASNDKNYITRNLDKSEMSSKTDKIEKNTNSDVLSTPCKSNFDSTVESCTPATVSSVELKLDDHDGGAPGSLTRSLSSATTVSIASTNFDLPLSASSTGETDRVECLSSQDSGIYMHAVKDSSSCSDIVENPLGVGVPDSVLPGFRVNFMKNSILSKHEQADSTTRCSEDKISKKRKCLESEMHKNDMNMKKFCTGQKEGIKRLGKEGNFFEFLKSTEGKQWLSSDSGKRWLASQEVQDAVMLMLSSQQSSLGSSVDVETDYQPDLSLMCSLCYIRPKNASIVHGHLSHQATCYRCARKLLDSGSRCPVCRRKIHMVTKNIII